MLPSHHDTLHILLADDDDDDCYFFEHALTRMPFEVQLATVRDCTQLIYYLDTHADHLPHLIFLDVHMPGRDCLQTLRDIRRHAVYGHIPVIIHSTGLSSAEVDDLYTAGAHYYLEKCMYDLTQCIQQVIDLLADSPGQPPRDQFVIRIAGSQHIPIHL